MAIDITAKNSLLTPDAVRRKIRRMAFEIAEHNSQESALLILGIAGNGAVLAKSLVEELRAIVSMPIHTGTITLNKREPVDARLDSPVLPDGQVVIVVDDVSNTGRTLLYALRPLLGAAPKKIQTLVLVERSHRLFAVQPDYVGLTVSTTLQEHITVETEGDAISGAWLH